MIVHVSVFWATNRELRLSLAIRLRRTAAAPVLRSQNRTNIIPESLPPVSVGLEVRPKNIRSVSLISSRKEDKSTSSSTSVDVITGANSSLRR